MCFCTACMLKNYSQTTQSYAQAVAESAHGVGGHIVVKRWMVVAAVCAVYGLKIEQPCWIFIICIVTQFTECWCIRRAVSSASLNWCAGDQMAWGSHAMRWRCMSDKNFTVHEPPPIIRPHALAPFMPVKITWQSKEQPPILSVGLLSADRWCLLTIDACDPALL